MSKEVKVERGDAEKVLQTLMVSRKAFIVEYICGALLLILLMMLHYNGIVLPSLLTTAILILAGVFLIASEIARHFMRYKITTHKLVIIRGIIKQSKKNIYWHPLGFVPDLNIRQGRLQRLMNYGSVFVAGGEKNSFEIKDINNPQKVMKKIEDLIEEHRE